MSKDKKAETKTGPPPISDVDHGRVTAETVVTDGPSGMESLSKLVRRILNVPKSSSNEPKVR